MELAEVLVGEHHDFALLRPARNFQNAGKVLDVEFFEESLFTPVGAFEDEDWLSDARNYRLKMSLVELELGAAGEQGHDGGVLVDHLFYEALLLVVPAKRFIRR